MDLSRFIPPDIDTQTATSMQYYGLLGDYIGGAWGTVIATLTLTAVLATWWMSRRVDYRAKTFQIFTEMMRTHEEIVASMQVNTRKGRETFASVLSEFYVIYKLTRQVVPDDATWSIPDRIDIAYTCTFFGPHLSTEEVLRHYGGESITRLFGAIHTERQANGNGRRAYGGHQLRLSHYFRNLYSAYSFIEGTKLGSDEKLALAKVLRSKLSNHEQAVLALNIMSHLGQEWERTGLVEKYQPIKNVPKLFLTFDRTFLLKERFPYINFEWESAGNEVVKIDRVAIGTWSFILLRRKPRPLTSRSTGPRA